ncbi:MAG: HAMP domain-containing sensor histidine kinase [Desulfobacteraceae bacterium]|jgi:signal transduction histidine kinase
MPLKIFDRIAGRLGFRLAMWYSGLIIACMIVLFFIAYYFLSETLKDRDADEIQSELSELESEFDKGGLEGVKSFIDLHLSSRLKNLLFIRLADTQNHTIYLCSPFEQGEYDIGSLSTMNPAHRQWTRLKSINSSNDLILQTSLKEKDMILQLGMSNQPRKEILHHFRELFLIGVIPLVVIGMIFGVFLSTHTLKPLRHIIGTVGSIDIGKMDSRVPRTENGDELDELARLFNDMLDRIDRLIRGMKDSLDNVAHDLRTPLTRLRNISERALVDLLEKDPCREAHESVLEESDRILNMLDTLMDISEAETGVMALSKKDVSLKNLILPIFEMYQMVAETRQISISLHIPEDLSVYADPDKMGQIIANLLDNAVKFTGENGRVVIEAEKEETRVKISIRDNGPGIPQHDMDRIWDRLYRGDQSRSQKGLGLGLSLVKAIVSAHKGTIDVESRLGGGSVFTLWIPGRISPHPE